MHAEDSARAVTAVTSIASSLGLRVDDAVVLSDSNRLVLRLLPSDIVARVASVAHFASAQLEVDLATQLAGCPIAGLDPRVAPRVFVGDDFEITFWEHFEPVPARTVPTAEYVGALVSLHAGLRRAAISAPHVRDRILATLEFVTSRELTPDLADKDRTLLTSTMRDLGESIVAPAIPEQLLHGEPHPWNLLDTNRGVQFIDFENTCLGPLEYDLAWVPDDVATRYPTSTGRCLAIAERSCLRSSQRIAGVATTATRVADDQAMPSSMRCATGHPGRHSIRSPGDHPRRSKPESSAAQPAIWGSSARRDTVRFSSLRTPVPRLRAAELRREFSPARPPGLRSSHCDLGLLYAAAHESYGGSPVQGDEG